MENFSAILNTQAEIATIATEPVLIEGSELSLTQHELTQEELSKRILGYVTEKQTYGRLKTLIPSRLPEDETAFVTSCLEDVEYDTRVYSLEGHTTRVLVPEEYAQKLDIVRQRRLGQIDLLPENMIGYLNRVLPEDILSILDELPNRSYVGEISLVDWFNPRDVWIRALRKSETFTSAASTTPAGQVLLYRFDISEFLRLTIFHEWNHVLQARFMDEVDRPWRAAVNMEWFVWVNRDYALVNPGEHWAVFGEAILQKDGSLFAEVVNKLGPMRTMIWTTALGKALDALSVAERSCYHDIWVARVAYARKNALSLASAAAAETLKHAQCLDGYLTSLSAPNLVAAA
jgi:hypothetical protein